MRELHFSGGVALVDDEAAVALLEYASALARADTSTTVDLVTVESGEPATTTFLVGPASDLVATQSTSWIDPPDNSATVVFMREQTKKLNDSPAARGVEHPPHERNG